MTDITIFENMLGKTIESITGAECSSDCVHIVTTDKSEFLFSHEQDCCENVRIIDVIGDVDDLLHSPLLIAEEIIDSYDGPPLTEGHDMSDGTWTFYRFGTVKGIVTVRWLGESNGYYSERVTYEEKIHNKPWKTI